MIASAPRGLGASGSRCDSQPLGHLERLLERLERQLHPIPASPRSDPHVGTERPSEGLAEPLGGLELVGMKRAGSGSGSFAVVDVVACCTGPLLRLTDRPSLRRRLARQSPTRV